MYFICEMKWCSLFFCIFAKNGPNQNLYEFESIEWGHGKFISDSSAKFHWNAKKSGCCEFSIEIIDTTSWLVKCYRFDEIQLLIGAFFSSSFSAVCQIIVGKYAAKMMPLFKIAVKNKNVQAIVRIIELGENWNTLSHTAWTLTTILITCSSPFFRAISFQPLAAYDTEFPPKTI